MNNQAKKEITVVDGVEYVTENGILCGVNMRQEIKTLNIPDTVQGVGRFLNSHVKFSLQEIRFPDTVHTLPEGLLESSRKLRAVRLPGGISEIPEKFFRECWTLKEITVPDGVTAIGASAFQNCEKLTRVVLPDSVAEIGRFAFKGCTALGEVVIPASVQTICGALFAEGTPSLRILYAGSSARWEGMMKQEENTVKLYYDDGYHHGRGLHITYVEYYPIFYSSHEDFVCEVHCLEDGKTLVYHREEPIPSREIERYDDGM